MTSEAKIKNMKDLPGSYGLPVIGKSLNFMKAPTDWLSQSVLKYGSIFKTSLLLEKSIVISDPEVAQYIQRQENKLVRADWPKPTKTLLGEGALTVVHGQAHGKLRQLLTGAFQPKMLETLCPIVVDAIKLNLNDWASKDKVENMNLAVRDITLDNSLKVVLGVEGLTEDDFKNLRNDVLCYSFGLFAIPLNVRGTAYHSAMQARKRILAFVEARIESLRKEMKEKEIGTTGDETYSSVVEKLIATVDEDAAVDYGYEAIRDNALTLVFAAMDTSSSTMVTLSTILHYRPEIRKKLVEEQERIVAEYGEEFTPEIVSKMKYLNAVIYDFLQVFPIIGNTFRKALVDFNLPGRNIQVKKGQKLVISYHGQHFHYNPEDGLASFEKRAMELFNPDRAMEELENKTDNGKVWVPFGQGKRRCIGEPLANLTMRLFFAQLVRKYDFEVVGEKSMPKWSWFPVPKPTNNITMKFKAKE